MQAFQDMLDRTLGSAAVVDTYCRAFGAQVAPIATPFLHERDLFMAWTLKRSKAVHGAQCVVGVMGAMHLRGVYHALLGDTVARRVSPDERDSTCSHKAGACGHELRYTALVASWGTAEERNAALVDRAGAAVLEVAKGSLLWCGGMWAVTQAVALLWGAQAQ